MRPSYARLLRVSSLSGAVVAVAVVVVAVLLLVVVGVELEWVGLLVELVFRDDDDDVDVVETTGNVVVGADRLGDVDVVVDGGGEVGGECQMSVGFVIDLVGVGVG